VCYQGIVGISEKLFAEIKLVLTFASRKRNSGKFSDNFVNNFFKIKFANSTKVSTFAARQIGNEIADCTLKRQTKNKK
jgi:hypothetical protein